MTIPASSGTHVQEIRKEFRGAADGRFETRKCWGEWICGQPDRGTGGYYPAGEGPWEPIDALSLADELLRSGATRRQLIAWAERVKRISLM